VEEVSLARFALGRAIGVRAHAAPRFEGNEVIRRARSRIGEDRYRLLSNNCEHFCEWCLQDEQRSYQVERLLNLPRGLARVCGGAFSCLRSNASGALDWPLGVLRALPPSPARNPGPAVSDCRPFFPSTSFRLAIPAQSTVEPSKTVKRGLTIRRCLPFLNTELRHGNNLAHHV
jgi:hypothetical protein